MKIDTHVHLLVSKAAPPDWQEIPFMLDSARRDGLDVLCICEHLDAVHYPDLMRGLFIERRLPGTLLRPGVYRLENGLVISAGAEVSLRGGGDVGVHATTDLLLSLNRQKGFYSLPELLVLVAGQGDRCAAVAHHVYYGTKWIADLPKVGGRLDAVELPAKDLASRDKYRSLSGDLGLPLVGGGDGHTWIQIGACYTELDDGDLGSADDFSVPAFKAALKRRHVKPVPVPGAERFIRMSRIYRERLDAAAV
jgi:hypothetical protein